MKPEHERLSQYLNGELPREKLSPELQAEADGFLRPFEEAKRERITAPPWLGSAVMRRVRAAPRSRWRGVLDWLVTPKVVRLTPVTAVLVLAAGITLGTVMWRRAAPGPEIATEMQDGRVTTRFVFVAPEASSVAVTGDFVGWRRDGIPLERDPNGNGLWVAVVRLQPGVHQYAFVIDGTEWRPDPNASQLDDGFGQKNSVLLVPPARS